MHLRPGDEVLGVLSEGDPSPLALPCRIHLLASILAFHRGTPARLIIGSGPPLIEDAYSFALYRPNSLLVSVASTTEKSRGPNTGAVSEDATWCSVFFPPAPANGLPADVVLYGAHVFFLPVAACRPCFAVNLRVRTACEHRVVQYSWPFPAMKGRPHPRHTRKRDAVWVTTS